MTLLISHKPITLLTQPHYNLTLKPNDTHTNGVFHNAAVAITPSPVAKNPVSPLSPHRLQAYKNSHKQLAGPVISHYL